MTFFGKPRARSARGHAPRARIAAGHADAALHPGARRGAAGFLFKAPSSATNMPSSGRARCSRAGQRTPARDSTTCRLWVELSPFIAMVLGFVTAWYMYIRSPEHRSSLASSIAGSTSSCSTSGISTSSTTSCSCAGQAARQVPVEEGRRLRHRRLWPERHCRPRRRRHQPRRRLQTGYLYHYAFAMLIGVAALVTWMMLGSEMMTDWPILSRGHLPAAGRRAAHPASDQRRRRRGRRNIRWIALATTIVHLRHVAVDLDRLRQSNPASRWSRSMLARHRHRTIWASTASRCCSSS
jgi:hypothetical protein